VAREDGGDRDIRHRREEGLAPPKGTGRGPYLPPGGVGVGWGAPSLGCPSSPGPPTTLTQSSSSIPYSPPWVGWWFGAVGRRAAPVRGGSMTMIPAPISPGGRYGEEQYEHSTRG